MNRSSIVRHHRTSAPRSFKLGSKTARLGVIVVLLLAAPVFAENAEKAKSIVVMVCSACHGMDGNSTTPTIPKLAGRHPDYIVREMKEFISGKRKSDIMAPIIATLDAEDFKGLGDYFGSQKSTSGTILDPKAAEAGKKFYLEGNEQTGVPACAGCHEVDGAGSKRFPRLAGQHREYLIEQMQNFQKDIRNNDTARAMREVAKRMNGDEIRAVAEFLTGL